MMSSFSKNSSTTKSFLRSPEQLEELVNSLFKQLRVPSFILVNLDAVANNVDALRRHLSPGTEVIAVVKADAHNMGMLPVAKVLLEKGVQQLAVATVSEGICLRKNGVKGPIIVLGNLIKDEVEDVLKYDLMPSLSWDRALQGFRKEKLVCTDGRRLRVNINIDTGMSRYGVQPEDLAELVEFLDDLEVDIQSMYTHFYAPITESHITKGQLETFLKATTPYKHRPISYHITSSRGLMQGLGTDLDFVRVGSCLSGFCSGATKEAVAQHEAFGFQPPLSMFARPIFFELLPSGKKVGLHAPYETTKPEWIAIFTAGWSDGYCQKLINTGVLRRVRTGEMCPVVGALSLGSIAVKLSEAPGLGEVFQVLSDDYDEVTSFEALSQNTGHAIHDEHHMWSLRMPRVFMRGRSVTEIC